MWQVIGQGRAVSLLQQSLKAGKLAHAYLMVGPQHVGKMTLAIKLAQALNCEAVERPCLECVSCKKIAAGTHADVRVIGLSQNEDDSEAKLIGIDQINEILHSANLSPFEGKQRIFIIDGAELLSADAANCLLKTLEEPEAKVTFILLTTNDRLLLPTVVSRCQRLELTPLSIVEATRELTEKQGIEPERARLLAGLSHGCPGWAIIACGDGHIMQRRDEELNEIIGVIKAEYAERFDYAGRLAARFSQNRGAIYETLDRWLDWWRDMLLARLGGQDMITNIDRKNELIEMAGGYSPAQIRGCIGSIGGVAEQLKQNVNARLALEVLMLDIPHMKGGVVKNG